MICYCFVSCGHRKFQHLFGLAGLTCHPYRGGNYVQFFLRIFLENFINGHKNQNKLRKVLKSYYKLVIKFSNFQHHGLIIYTEYDLNNYRIGFLPTEALKGKNLNLLNSEKIKFQKQMNKNKSLSRNILLERGKYITKGIKNKYYDHHVFG